MGSIHFATADSIWGCPCGWTGKKNAMGGHRKGAKNNPACRGPGPRGSGKVWMIDPGSGPRVAMIPSDEDPASTSPAPAPAPEPIESAPLADELPATQALAPNQGAGDVEAGSSGPWEFRLQDSIDDPEALAAEMNRQRLGGDLPASGNGHATMEAEDLGGAGEWTEERGPAVAKVPGGSETVYLPAVIKVWYQWCLDNGWKIGDGLLGTWVTDVLLTHMNTCMGKGIYVMDRAEVRNATTGTQHG